MGQDNTHVRNTTDEEIEIVLTDNNDRNTTQIIEPGGRVKIQTVDGAVTVSAFKKDGTRFAEKAAASYTNYSDRGFIVKDVNGHLNIVRAKNWKCEEEADDD